LESAGVLPNEQRGNFVTRHWRGGYSLGISYWVTGLLAGNIVSALLVAVATMLADRAFVPILLFICMAVIWIIVVLVALWQIVGIWRAANNHMARRLLSEKKKGLWGRAAKVAVSLSLLQVGNITLRVGVPQIQELYSIAFLGDPAIPDYAIRLLGTGTDIAVTGGFKYGLNRDLDSALDVSPQVTTVHLQSLGGRTAEAIAVHDQLKRRGLDTYVAGECDSACTVAFVGGSSRWVLPDAVLGFHAGTFTGADLIGGAGVDNEMAAVFSAAGVGITFVSRATSTPNDDMWFPDSSELLASGFITGLADYDQFPASGLGADVDLATIAELMKSALPAMAALQRVALPDYEELLSAALSAYESGQSFTQIIMPVGQHLDALIARSLPLADDAAMIKLGELMIDQYRELSAIDPQLCASMGLDGDPTGEIAGHFSDDLILQESELNGDIILSAAPRSRGSEQQLSRYWDRLNRRLAEALTPREYDMIGADSIMPDQYRAYCRGTIVLYEEIVAMGTPASAALIREIFTPQ
jgi:hypothetical protein